MPYTYTGIDRWPRCFSINGFTSLSPSCSGACFKIVGATAPCSLRTSAMSFSVGAYPKEFFEGIMTQMRNTPISIQKVTGRNVA